MVSNFSYGYFTEIHSMRRKLIIALLLLVFLMIIWIVRIPSFSDEALMRLAEDKVKQYQPPKSSFVIIVDYRRPVFADRLYLIDLKKRKIVLRAKVGHAFRSGFFTPCRFGNIKGSNLSTYGTFQTASDYNGKYGYAMRVVGLDKGINDHTLKRAIVFHKNYIPVLMYSNGCFTTDEKVNRTLIETTKNGHLLCVVK